MKTKLTPAALLAANSGQLENFIAATTPGGIEAQEKRGQIAQSFEETLPIEGTSRPEDRQRFEALGFKFGPHPTGRELFIQAVFPKGWRKKPTDHSMWSEIIDDNGKKRGMIFYKAAFYDQSAFVRLEE